MEGGAPTGVLKFPSLFRTMTTLLLLGFVVKLRSIWDELIVDALKEPGSSTIGLLIIVKFTFEISKNILPTASTFILAWEVGWFGIVITSEPSFGVFAIITVLKLFPPSVDKRIFTYRLLERQYLHWYS